MVKERGCRIPVASFILNRYLQLQTINTLNHMSHLHIKLISLSVIITLFACKNDSHHADADQTKDTIAVLTSRIEKDSTNAKNYFNRAQAYTKKSMYDLAYFDMLKATQLDSNNVEYMTLYADLSFRMNKVKAARDVLEKVRAQQPDNYDAAFRLAEIFLYTNNQDLSLKYLDTVLQKEPKNTKAILMQGFNLKEKGDTASAVASFRKAIEFDPKFYEAQIQLGMIMYAQQNKLCVEYYKNALALKPGSEEAMYGLAMWYQDQRDFNKAIQFYTDIIQVNPKNKYAYFNLGYIHHEYLKVYHEAIKHYSKAIEADPNYSQAYYNRGLCYEYLGNIAAAKDDYTKALQIRHNDYPPAKDGLDRLSK